MQLSNYGRILANYGFTDKAFKAAIILFERIPFEKKSGLLCSSVNRDCSIATVSFVMKNGVRYTYSYNRAGKSVVISTRFSDDNIDFMLTSDVHNNVITNHFILCKLNDFFDEYPEIV